MSCIKRIFVYIKDDFKLCHIRTNSVRVVSAHKDDKIISYRK